MNNSDCLFCKIIRGEIPCKKVYEDESILAFYDIEPQAPCHIVMVPKVHISSPMEIDSSNSAVVAHIFEAAATLAKELGMEKGYRVVANCGEEGGQSVPHLHFHLLSGRNLGWPPG
ncbi:MAG: histidine triad nucleotide-binding protein [Oscillospiraceae bacterium]